VANDAQTISDGCTSFTIDRASRRPV